LRWLKRIVILRLHPEVGYKIFEVSLISTPHVFEEKLVHAWTAANGRSPTIGHIKGVRVIVHVVHVVHDVVHVVIHAIVDVVHIHVLVVPNIVVAIIKDIGQVFLVEIVHDVLLIVVVIVNYVHHYLGEFLC